MWLILLLLLFQKMTQKKPKNLQKKIHALIFSGKNSPIYQSSPKKTLPPPRTPLYGKLDEDDD
jgi:hypothetical protein